MLIKTYKGRPMKHQNSAGPDQIRIVLHEKEPGSDRGIQLVVSARDYEKNVESALFPNSVKRTDAVKQLIAQSKRR